MSDIFHAPGPWQELQTQLSPRVLGVLVGKDLWCPVAGPTAEFQRLTVQLAPYFGLYPGSETLRAEFRTEFGELDQLERDSLFRLVKSLSLGRDRLDADLKASPAP